jgi:hypothetical protein
VLSNLPRSFSLKREGDSEGALGRLTSARGAAEALKSPSSAEGGSISGLSAGAGVAAAGLAAGRELFDFEQPVAKTVKAKTTTAIFIK